MKSLLKLEILKIRTNKLLLAVIALAFILAIFGMGSRFSDIPLELPDMDETTVDTYDAQAAAVNPTYYYDEESYLRYANGFYETNFETLEEFYEFLDTDFASEWAVPRIMANSFGNITFLFLFAPFYFIWDFKRRGLEPLYAAGRCRFQITLSRAIGYYVIIILIELIATLLSLLFYARGWAAMIPFGRLLGLLGLKMLLLMGTASIPFLFLNLIKRVTGAGILCFVFCAAMAYLSTIHFDDPSIFVPFPVMLQINLSAWRDGAPAALLAHTAIWPVVYIAGSFLLSWLLISKHEIVK